MTKKRIASIVLMVIGLIVLGAGAVVMILKITATPAMADGDYLVMRKTWVLVEGTNCETNAETNSEAALNGSEMVESETAGTDSNATNCASGPRVVWNFTEIGKGNLTTNNHINDYEFAWSLEDGEHMVMQTDWLYKLNNEYEYKLDQSNGVLVLSDGESEYRFVAQNE